MLLSSILTLIRHSFVFPKDKKNFQLKWKRPCAIFEILSTLLTRQESTAAKTTMKNFFLPNGIGEIKSYEHTKRRQIVKIMSRLSI